MGSEDSIKFIRLTFSREELILISNALNEVCNGIHFDESEFHTRIGATREEARAVLRRIVDSSGGDPN